MNHQLIHRLAFRTIVFIGAAVGPTIAGPTAATAQLMQEELDLHRNQWEAAEPTHYVYRFQRLCFCLDEAVQPAYVEVFNDDILSVRHAETGEPLDEELFLSVDGLFDVLQDALNQDAEMLVADFHDQLGFPQEIHIDYSEMLADDEISYFASNVTVVPEPGAVAFLPVVIWCLGSAAAARRACTRTRGARRASRRR